jgi:hypothetical protein
MVLHTRKVRAVVVAGVLAMVGYVSPANGQGGPPGGPPGGGGGGPPNVTPMIASLNTIQVPGRKFRISGNVSDDTPGQCRVTITGAANGTINCDANGNFDQTFDVPTPGAITAVAADGVLQSGPTYATLANNAPTVSVSAVQGPGNTWTFSGSVGDECPAGLTVALSGPAGVNGATATVGANGGWSVTVTVLPGTSGYVTATATDWYSETGTGYTYFSS